MKPVAFEYCRADTVDEALDLLAEFGGDGRVMAGGMSLGALLNMRLVRPSAVIDINRVPGLDAIGAANGTIATGAAVRQADALKSAELMEAVPLLAEALPNVGHYQTRSRGTLGGSVAHADPSAEIPLTLATLDGEVVLRSKGGERRLKARAFLQGVLTTARREDELLTALVWPTKRPRTGYAFEEIAQRRGDFAITAVAAAAELDGGGNLTALSLGLGGVEARPVIARASPFIGKAATPELATEIADAAAGAVDPMEDLQANADYRRQLVRVLGARALTRAFERARKGN